MRNESHVGGEATIEPGSCGHHSNVELIYSNHT